MRGATSPLDSLSSSGRDFNPRTPCGVRRNPSKKKARVVIISIHAPHTGCDIIDHTANMHIINFNPRTPCGVRLDVLLVLLFVQLFQSTHPMRGATNIRQISKQLSRNFNPRTPCGVRPEAGFLAKIGESDFNPRTPCGVRRPAQEQPKDHCPISIHAPHAGCDSMVKIFRFYRRFQRHFREAENLPCTYRGFSQFFLLLASPSRYRIIVSLGS